MLRFLFRFLATILLAIAIVMAVVDATRSIAADALVMTPLGTGWAEASPATFEQARVAVSDAVPGLWDMATVSLLALPGWAVFAALALLAYAIGYRRDGRARWVAARS